MYKAGSMVIFGGHAWGPALPALPGLRQASPTQCLHLEHACTRCAPDVIGQNSCILKSPFSASNASSLHIKRTNRRWGIICARQVQWWCSWGPWQPYPRNLPLPPKSSIQCLHLPALPTQCASDVISQNSSILKSSFSALDASSLHIKRTNRRWGIIYARQGQWWCSWVSPTLGAVPLGLKRNWGKTSTYIEPIILELSAE